MNHNHVRTHFRDLLLDTSLRALADGKHGDNGCYADDDTQHGEEGAKLVVGKGAEGYFEKVCSVHCFLSYGLQATSYECFVA